MGYMTQQDREDNIRIGYTDKRGNAWWHRAGVTADGEPNHFPGSVPFPVAARLLDTAEVISAPVYYAVPATFEDMTGLDDSGMPIRFVRSTSDRQGILRKSTNDDHGVFKDGYDMHQFRTALLDAVGKLVEESNGDLGIGSVGLLRNGAIAWVSIEVPDTITTPEGVAFRPNLLATSAHDGSLSTTYKRVVTNVVCENTHAAALGEAGQQFKVKHSRYSSLKLADAREALGIIVDTGDAFAAEVSRLNGIKVTDDAWRAFLDAHAPMPDEAGRGRTLAENKRGELNKLYRHDERVAPWAGTAWGVVQAVNTFEHWSANVRGTTRNERNMTMALKGGFDKLDGDTLTTLTKVLATV